MHIGICLAPQHNSNLAEGYDYVELQVAPSLLPFSDDATFSSGAELAARQGLRVEAFNCFVPADLKLVGEYVDWQRVETYVTTAIRRAAWRGARVIVFGSGGARRIPDNFPRETAWGQLVRFLRFCSAAAKAHGVTIAIEPLNRGECNVLNSYLEGALLAEEVDRPKQVRVLADIYHFVVDGEPLEDILQAPQWLAHVHVSDSRHRYPGSGQYPLALLFAILKQIDYTGSVSIECDWGSDALGETRLALEFLRQLAS